MYWMALLLLLIAPAEAGAITCRNFSGAIVGTISPGKSLICDQTSVDNTNGPFLWAADCQGVNVSSEPDITGVAVGATIELMECAVNTGTVADICSTLQWDTTGDGIVDNNILDGVTVMRREIYFNKVGGWLLMDAGTAPAVGDTARYIVSCGL